MEKITTILFDFDGVITDTEPQYEVYFNQLGKEYNLGDHFAAKIRGVPLQDMLKKYLKNISETEKKKITGEVALFEEQMDFPLVRGVKEFLDYLKNNHYKIALVTSSPQRKMDMALTKLQLENTFDTVITANQITKGKPDPMCYLLAAEKLNATPRECLVFEDSIAGIRAAQNAAMTVIGVSTTLPDSELNKYISSIIPDFSDLSPLTPYLLRRNNLKK